MIVLLYSGEEDRLEKLMKEAFLYVTKKNRTKVKFNKNLTLGQGNQAKYSTGPDRDYYLDSIHAVNEMLLLRGILRGWKGIIHYTK